MALSLMDKVSDYSMQMLGKTGDDAHLMMSHYDDLILPPQPPPQQQQQRQVVRLRLHMETPVLAFPKRPGSYELLVANLGEIIIANKPSSVLHLLFGYSLLFAFLGLLLIPFVVVHNISGKFHCSKL